MKLGEKIWWRCSKTGIMVYIGMCKDTCYSKEIAICKDRINKPEMTIAKVQMAIENKDGIGE